MRVPESFDDFYAGSVGRVISQLYAMTGDRAEAEDVVQEADTARLMRGRQALAAHLQEEEEEEASLHV